MCLIIPKDQKVNVAKKDIKVYKILSKERCSTLYPEGVFTRKYFYPKDVLQKTEIKESKFFSAYDNKETRNIELKFPNWYKREVRENLKSLGQGFHSSLTRERIQENLQYRFQSELIFEATIPKGSEYYTSETGLVISNKIIVH